ncbi:hypothetical protein BV25DRAFT_1827537 [Artomyces pyxidatus]|uniref:Uncharacterized protein n=1 Tax=Artomyces pyxidatus TaxID=48021 RepID=A0ACB8SXP1_9AGAM|nr:hypothetical protein BV25DRAFT_1827537 [Artomyces pyxidatus]
MGTFKLRHINFFATRLCLFVEGSNAHDGFLKDVRNVSKGGIEDVGVNISAKSGSHTLSLHRIVSIWKQGMRE